MSYYEQRKNLKYYKKIEDIINRMSGESILDIGCMDYPIVLSGNFKERYTIDINNRPDIQNVKKIIGEWPKCSNLVPDKIDLILCMQVIEHIKDFAPFVKTIFEVGRTIIISLPWKWPKNACKYHVHDPIDEKKLQLLIPHKYKSLDIVKEKSGTQRAIMVYHNECY